MAECPRCRHETNGLALFQWIDVSTSDPVTSCVCVACYHELSGYIKEWLEAHGEPEPEWFTRAMNN